MSQPPLTLVDVESDDDDPSAAHRHIPQIVESDSDEPNPDEGSEDLDPQSVPVDVGVDYESSDEDILEFSSITSDAGPPPVGSSANPVISHHDGPLGAGGSPAVSSPIMSGEDTDLPGKTATTDGTKAGSDVVRPATLDIPRSPDSPRTRVTKISPLSMHPRVASLREMELSAAAKKKKVESRSPDPQLRPPRSPHLAGVDHDKLPPIRTRRRRKSILRRISAYDPDSPKTPRPLKKSVRFTSHVEIRQGPTYYLRNAVEPFYELNAVLDSLWCLVPVLIVPLCFLAIGVAALVQDYVSPTLECRRPLGEKPTGDEKIANWFTVLIALYAHCTKYFVLSLVAFVLLVRKLICWAVSSRIDKGKTKKLVKQLRAQDERREERRKSLSYSTSTPVQRDSPVPILRNRNDSFEIDRDKLAKDGETPASPIGVRDHVDELDVFRMKRKAGGGGHFHAKPPPGVFRMLGQSRFNDSIQLSRKQLALVRSKIRERKKGEQEEEEQVKFPTIPDDDDDEGGITFPESSRRSGIKRAIDLLRNGRIQLAHLTESKEKAPPSCAMCRDCDPQTTKYVVLITLVIVWMAYHLVTVVGVVLAAVSSYCVTHNPTVFYANVFFCAVDFVGAVVEILLLLHAKMNVLGSRNECC